MRRSADEAALRAIARVRAGEKDYESGAPFSVVSSTGIFRQRLIELQMLPVKAPLAGEKELLPAVPHWKHEYMPVNGHEDDLFVAEGSAAAGGHPVLMMTDVLALAAQGSHEYQARKERLFQTALALDLEEDAFRNTFSGMLAGEISTDLSSDEDFSSTAGEGSLSAGRLLKGGTRLAAALTVDLVRVLTAPTASALGLQFDTSITIPLGRGARRHIAAETLTQAQRDLLYAVLDFEHYKKGFALATATRYLRTLSVEDQVRNAEENYQRLTVNARRARRLADAGRLPEIQVDQAIQEQLRAWNGWINARRQAADALDDLKVELGLSPDAEIRLDRNDLENLDELLAERLPFLHEDAVLLEETAVAADAPVELPEPATDGGGPYELPTDEAVLLALDNRLDLRIAIAQIEDAMRKVVVAADALGPDFSLRVSGTLGERRSPSAAAAGDSRLRPGEGNYAALLRLDPPLNRTAERNNFRNSQIELDRAVRAAQAAEDRVKQQVRGNLRALLQARESLRIQSEAVRIAQRRVESSNLFLEAGRAAVRDVLEAQDALLSARNAFTEAMVDYRLTEIELQRNMGLLRVDARGQLIEMDPENAEKI